jgi:hypothetical protein
MKFAALDAAGAIATVTSQPADPAPSPDWSQPCIIVALAAANAGLLAAMQRNSQLRNVALGILVCIGGIGALYQT